jgi:diadenosine tetraphosphate (Ap4A) HIT family hydrolase
MTSYTVFEGNHWLVGHRQDSRYPGYLMVSSRESKADLSELTTDALQELGPTLKRAEQLLQSVYAPYKVIFYKLGFSSGFSCHFHVAPVTRRLLTEIKENPDFTDDPDGNDAILFLSRVYCERSLTDVELIDMRNTISQLKDAASGLFTNQPL